MFHGIEELTDVQIQHPVYLSRHNRRMQGIQCVMLTSSRSESIGNPQKISLVDLVQHLLDDNKSVLLVLIILAGFVI